MAADFPRVEVECRSRFAGRAPRVLWVRTDRPLWEGLREGGRPVAASCAGAAVCGLCIVKILAGAEALTPTTPDERRVLSLLGIDEPLRLACRARVRAPGLVLGTDYW